MNIVQLRQSLKEQWLGYYRDNRQWLTRLGIWVNCDGQRRPASSFILATLSVLEPELTQMLPLVVDLSNHPDRIVSALGLNFNPDTELKALETNAATIEDKPVKLLPSGYPAANPSGSKTRRKMSTDELRRDSLPRA